MMFVIKTILGFGLIVFFCTDHDLADRNPTARTYPFTVKSYGFFKSHLPLGTLTMPALDETNTPDPQPRFEKPQNTASVHSSSNVGQGNFKSSLRNNPTASSADVRTFSEQPLNSAQVIWFLIIGAAAMASLLLACYLLTRETTAQKIAGKSEGQST